MFIRSCPLKYMPYAQAHVEKYEDGMVALISYRTGIIQIDAEGWLKCSGLYSRTTIRHISAFMKEYGNGLSYYSAKDAYVNNYAINIYTGEIIEL